MRHEHCDRLALGETLAQWRTGCLRGIRPTCPVTSLLPGCAKLAMTDADWSGVRSKSDGNGRGGPLRSHHRKIVFGGSALEVAQTWRKYPDRPQREPDAS